MRSKFTRFAWFTVVCSSLTTVTMVAAEMAECNSGDVYLTVTPAEPGCNDTITVGARILLTDSCWSVSPPVFLPDAPDFLWDIDRFDSYEPGRLCLQVALEIPFTQSIGPLEAGPYSVRVDFSSTSPRYGDFECSSWIPFDVVCCPDLPPAADNLRLALSPDRSEAVLTWADVPGADDYVVFGSATVDGPFTNRVAFGATGLIGVQVPLGVAPEFLLVAGRNVCGVGPRK